MPPFTLTPTRDAASCQTFLGRTAEAVVGVADGISGGRDGVTLPPPFCKLIFATMLPRGRRKAALQREQSQACLASVEREQARPKVKAASGASAAECREPP